MRRCSVAVVAALALTACTRQVYSVPAPAREPAPVVLAGASRARGSISGSETVNYLLSRALLVPVAGRAAADLRDSFDEGRDGGRTHRALDILAPRGTPVLAADDGRILRTGWNALGGNTIFAADPAGRVVYYYAHLDAYHGALAAGARVARGDTLGFVGTTGNAPPETPHLHFQVMRMPDDGRFWDGEPINPYPLFLLTAAARP